MHILKFISESSFNDAQSKNEIVTNNYPFMKKCARFIGEKTHREPLILLKKEEN